MSTPTYDLIETTTLTSAASSVTFSSITQDYRDLVLVMEYKAASTSISASSVQFNGDATSNYSNVWMTGNGSTASSGSNTTTGGFGADATTTNPGLTKVEILDYSATDKHKSFLTRRNNASASVFAFASRWANTDAITSLTVLASGDDFASGATFSLYGIAA